MIVANWKSALAHQHKQSGMILLMKNQVDGVSCALTVLYDGDCPLCRSEIRHFQGLDALEPVAWQDVSTPLATLPAGGKRSAYMARFHVQLRDGTILSGAAAFIALWSVLPGWRWLGRVGRLPGITRLVESGYRCFLLLRPHLQWLARRLEARSR